MAKGKRTLTVPEQHQLRIARDTLRMSPAMAAVMGGPTIEEARAIIARLSGREVAPIHAGQHDHPDDAAHVLGPAKWSRSTVNDLKPKRAGK